MTTQSRKSAAAAALPYANLLGIPARTSAAIKQLRQRAEALVRPKSVPASVQSFGEVIATAAPPAKPARRANASDRSAISLEERARCAAIFRYGVEANQIGCAASLAFHTDVSVDEAIRIMKTMSQLSALPARHR